MSRTPRAWLGLASLATLWGWTLRQAGAEDLGRIRDAHWLVGAQAEYAQSKAPRVRNLDSLRVGVGVAYRYRSWGPHAKLLVSPNLDSYEAFSGQTTVGLRSHFEGLSRAWSYGVAIHGEVRLHDHFWLFYATPLEVGTVVHEKGSLRVSVLAGVRRAIAGDLINKFWLDPNGLNNRIAQESLKGLRDSHPWEAFISLDFARLL